MTTASAVTRRPVLRALRFKESLENRPALLIGWIIFVVLPLIWSGLLIWIDPHHEVNAGFVTLTLIVGGWLFGAVFGAQIVCRDFGRREGHFLISRPVAAREAASAKFWVGFFELGCVLVTTAIIEIVLFAMSRHAANPIFQSLLPLRNLLLAALATVAAYAIAFVAAVITRNALAASLVATFLLVLVAVSPLLISGLSRLLEAPARWRWETYVAVQSELEQRAKVDPNFDFALAFREHNFALTDAVAAFAIPLAGFALLAAALVALAWLGRHATTWNTRVELHTKSVAWAIAAIVVGLLVAAFREVGATIPITSRFWWPGGIQVQSYAAAPHWLVATSSYAGAVYSLEIDDAGRAGNLNQINLPEPEPFIIDLGIFGSNLGFVRRIPAFVSADEVLVVTSDRRPQRDDRYPPDQQPRLPSYVPDYRIHAYGVKLHAGFGPDSGNVQLPIQARARDLRFGPPTDLGALPMEGPLAGTVDARVFDIHVEHDLLAVYLAVSSDRDCGLRPTITGACHWFLARYELPSGIDDPPRFIDAVETGEDTRSFGLLVRFFRQDADGATRLHCSTGIYSPLTGERVFRGHSAPAYPENGDALLVAPDTYVMSRVDGLTSSVYKLAVIEKGQVLIPPVNQPLGRISISPLSAWFRDDASVLVSPRKGQVWEIQTHGLTGYDVSDPTRLRRIGHVTSSTMYFAAACPDFIVLDHGGGISIVKLPK